MGYLNKESYKENREEKVFVKFHKTLTIAEATRICGHMICGSEIRRRAGILMVQDANGDFYCLKDRTYGFDKNKDSFRVISDKNFDGEWSRIGQLNVLSELDIEGMCIVYRLDGIRINGTGDTFNITKIIKE